MRLERINSHVEIIVSDTGQGIKQEFLPHVFDRFRQGDCTLSRMHGGLGLGLAIVRHLVELHGGTVDVISGGEGQGATFLDSEQGGQAPAVALTAHARVEDRVRTLSTGFQSHITKPVNVEELVAVIRSLARRSRTV